MTIAFWCILVAGLLPLLAGVYAKMSKPGYDNDNPRHFMSGLEGEGARANAAMQNGFEGFPLFAASVLVAAVQKADPTMVNILAVAYVLIRLAYAYTYIKGYSNARSSIWFTGLICVVGIFITAL